MMSFASAAGLASFGAVTVLDLMVYICQLSSRWGVNHCVVGGLKALDPSNLSGVESDSTTMLPVTFAALTFCHRQPFAEHKLLSAATWKTSPPAVAAAVTPPVVVRNHSRPRSGLDQFLWSTPRQPLC